MSDSYSSEKVKQALKKQVQREISEREEAAISELHLHLNQVACLHGYVAVIKAMERFQLETTNEAQSAMVSRLAAILCEKLGWDEERMGG